MTVLSSPLALILLAVSIVLHIVGVFVPDKYLKIIVFVNICLHIWLFSVLIISGIPLEETVAVCTVSVFAYTLSAFLRFKFFGRADK